MVDAFSIILFFFTDHLQVNEDVIITEGLLFIIGNFLTIKSDQRIIISSLLPILFKTFLIPAHVPFSLVL